MSRMIVGFAFLWVVLSGGPAAAEIATLDNALAEMSLGNPNAPVTMVEYASLGCSHCADFHKNTLPILKKEYIDTGKVRLIYRDFPLGNLALAASMISRCAGPKKYFGLVEIFFHNQSSWTHSDTPLEEMEKIARFAGLSVDDVDTCLDNATLLKTLQERKHEASRRYGIDSTPTFIIEGTKVPGNLPVDDFRDILDKALAKKR